MKTTLDLDTILFRLFKNSAISTAISGGIYLMNGRPSNSEKEDIEINSITLTQEYLPQTGTSNINIYVPDMAVKINNEEQRQPNIKRLKELLTIAMDVVRSASIKGLKIIPTNETVLSEPNIKQHFVNIRCDWNIQI